MAKISKGNYKIPKLRILKIKNPKHDNYVMTGQGGSAYLTPIVRLPIDPLISIEGPLRPPIP